MGRGLLTTALGASHQAILVITPTFPAPSQVGRGIRCDATGLHVPLDPLKEQGSSETSTILRSRIEVWKSILYHCTRRRDAKADYGQI